VRPSNPRPVHTPGTTGALTVKEKHLGNQALALAGRPDMFLDMIEPKLPSCLSNREFLIRKRLPALKLLLCLASAPIVLFAQDDRAKRLDDLFQTWSQPGTPGAAVAVIQHGKLVFEKGYGSANLEYDIPVTPQTVYHVASVSKQFTAMALVLLEQEGKLSLADDVHKYLPELPDYGHLITLRQLLQHTSGVRDQWQTLALAGWRLDDVITQKQILGLLFRQKELNFAPGTAHLYSNGGYTLAAELVARVSGKPFPDFCQ